ncbi:MAG: 4Fe-4S binding protein [Deltaproteobacteria bacterium]|nr:4Fe-4S binding protein [Deltaproteobacteria bacterium]
MTTEFDYKKCTKCGNCYYLCPLDVISLDEEEKPYVKYPDECQLCFICQVECSVKAIHVKIPLAFW